MNDPLALLPQQNGRTAIVTGANSGLGWHIALELARKGTRVILACRDLNKAEQACDLIRQQIPSADLTTQALDLANLNSVRQFAEQFRASGEPLHLLCNNAGVMFLPYRQSADGYELQMATNHLGHFLLTGLLLDRLATAPDSRVVTMTSGFNRFGHIPTHFPSTQAQSRFQAYFDAKLANLVFTLELQDRLDQANIPIKSLAAHPGYAATNLQYGATNLNPGSPLASIERLIMRLSNRSVAQSAAQGALPALYAALTPNPPQAAYYGPDGLLELRGLPTRARIPRQALNKPAAELFWKASEAATGITYPVADAPKN